MTNITENAFNGVSSTLKSLSIRNAKFHRIPSAFIKLTTLETLRLDTIDISDWNSPALQNVADTILSLYLVVIDLTEWPSWVSGCRSLHRLKIIASTLYSIPDDAFVALNETLTSLTIHYADFSQIPTALSSLGNLTTLDITGNHLASVNGREGLQQVTTFPWARTLLKLTGGNMFLTSLPDLSAMICLTRLDLRYNKITEVSSDLLPKDLEILILNENRITVITEVSFTNLSRLELLDMGSNPISRISYKAFNDLTSLKTLRLYNTRLKYIPLAFWPLSGLKSLDMSVIPTLECPCPIVVIDAHLWFINNSVEVAGLCRNQQTISSYLNFSCPHQAPTTSTTGGAPVPAHGVGGVFIFAFTFVTYICCVRLLSHVAVL